MGLKKGIVINVKSRSKRLASGLDHHLSPLASNVEADIFLFGVADSDLREVDGLLSPEK